jgi:hypothetical protein
MIGTAGAQQEVGSFQFATTAWTADFANRKISPSPSLLPELGNNSKLSGAVEATQTSDTEPLSKRAQATRAVTENPKQLSYFKSLESWVGRVISIEEGGQFSALVVSDKHPETRETAEFSVDEISDDDQSLVQVGANFYWSIGYQIDAYGGRSTASVLRFQRLRHWTRKELELARTKSAEYSDWFVGVADDVNSTSAR